MSSTDPVPAAPPPAAPPAPPAPPAPSAPAAGPRETYSHGHHASVLAAHGRRTAETSAAYLLPHLRTTDVLLDVGAGPGTITADLAGRVAQVVGLDPADAAVAAARQHVAGRELTNVRIEVGDVYALDAPDDAYDVVHAHQVLQHLADPVAALREMRRVCRPGGLVAVRDADYATMTWFPESAALTRWLALYEDLARRNGGEPDAGRRLKAWALEAGFTDVTASGSVWCYASPEDLDWWSGTWAERLTASSFATSALAHG
ncbi:MAG: methyltransferase domain-containing protein, partial [Janthinobacterium lividum]